jgi:hypothetical protein
MINQQTEWTDIKVALPDLNKLVLTLRTEVRYVIGELHMSPILKELSWFNGSSYYDNVTHWMYLPDLPVKTSPPAIEDSLEEQKQAILKARPNWKVIHDAVMAGKNSVEIGLELGLDDSGIRRSIRQMRELEILPPTHHSAIKKLAKKIGATQSSKN